jgi:hypothetical protein
VPEYSQNIVKINQKILGYPAARAVLGRKISFFLGQICGFDQKSKGSFVQTKQKRKRYTKKN